MKRRPTWRIISFKEVSGRRPPPSSHDYTSAVRYYDIKSNTVKYYFKVNRNFLPKLHSINRHKITLNNRLQSVMNCLAGINKPFFSTHQAISIWNGSYADERSFAKLKLGWWNECCLYMGGGLAEQFFVKKKLDWWKNCLLTRSWNDEGILW